ncbi:c-type cytochrome [Motiliproteus sediminis]|uniref:c-type cytochrome n=1 Tax=Motiliproteus sediminis TaxID=1468178 RepID=UPI001AEFC8C9|nr:cytochrome c [Motiliproteus sediminis]
MPRSYIQHALIVTLSTLAVNVMATSETPQPALVEQRIEAMKELKTQMKLIADMVRGRTEFTALAIQQAATEIAAHAPEISGLFPEGSLHSPSNALPAIWEQKAKFDRLATDLETNAVRLANNAARQSQNDSKKDFRQIGRVCAACHKHFRQKQKDDGED